MLLLALFRVLTFVLTEDDEIVPPDDFETVYPDEFNSLLNEWFEYNDKVKLKKIVLSVGCAMNEAMNKISGAFEWKLFQYFSTYSLGLSSYVWIPASVEPKLIEAFRTALAIAVRDASDMIPTEVNLLSDFVKNKLENCHLMPENDTRWTELIAKREKEIETIRQVTDESGTTIKYMIFSLQNQPFKLIRLNPQVVTGIWAEQINETVYFEIEDRERGSVQFDQFTLRNIISQSASPPTGYPEVICPVTLSFDDTI
ncbi:pecanex-like protein 2 [Histomonas meleagridis]|uniref:pecanex-like protein 2 n=1 Tax=Histomonas meleagridis TaxID=135588 RepID=UPI00355A2AC2|nr:pecanex-like protein 2 [Histomonas meleagridis]KAH0805918.1 pecanex-like protein 2 [Histomonas meleagridis]